MGILGGTARNQRLNRAKTRDGGYIAHSICPLSTLSLDEFLWPKRDGEEERKQVDWRQDATEELGMKRSRGKRSEDGDRGGGDGDHEEAVGVGDCLRPSEVLLWLSR